MKSKKFFIFALLSLLSYCSAWAQWVHATGTDSGFIVALTADQRNLFAGGDKGLYRSTNYGLDWHSVNISFASNIGSITSLINVGNYVLTGAFDGGIYRSTNNGEEWETSLKILLVYALARRDSVLFATACTLNDNGLRRSTDFGVTWEDIFEADCSPSILVSDTSIMIGFVKLYASTDNGDHWKEAVSNPFRPGS